MDLIPMRRSTSLFRTTLFLALSRQLNAVPEGETCVEACRALVSCEAYSPQTCLALEQLLGCTCPACSLNCRRRLDENATAPTTPCLGELNCDDGFATLGITCAFLEEESVGLGAPESCDCSSSICPQDDATTYVAPADVLCNEYVEDDLEARPCVALTRPATDSVVVKKGDALSVDGREQRWMSSGRRRPVTIEAGATLAVSSATIDALITLAQALAAGGAIAAWTGSEVLIHDSMLIAPHATSGGGIFMHAAASAIFEASRVSWASAERTGACAYVGESATLVFSASLSNDGTAQLGGGGFFTRRGSILHITGSLVQRDFAGNGGVLLAYGSVYAANSTFSDNFASGLCGGFLMLDSDAFFLGEDLVLRQLTAIEHAGAILGVGFSDVPPTVSMRRVHIENCHAEWGGSVGIYAGILDLEQVVITQSVGLNIDESTATIIGSVVTNCTESSIGGGCMWTSSSVVTMIDSQLKGCTAPRGGAIFAETESRLALRNVIIADSVATEGSGGAALFVGSSVLDADAVTFTNCTAADDGGAVSAAEDSSVGLGGPSILEGNVAAGPGGGISMRASDLYVAARCSFVVFTSVEITYVRVEIAGVPIRFYCRLRVISSHITSTQVLTLDFSDGGGDFIDVARAWLVRAERHGPEAYFDSRGVLAKIVPVAGKRTSLELCLEPAAYELWTMSYLGEAWLDVKWELAMPFGDYRDYSETRFSSVGHPALVHGLQAASFKILGDTEMQHNIRFTRNLAIGDGGAVATFDSARVLTAVGSVFVGNLAMGGDGGAVYVGSLCTVDLYGVEATRNTAVNGASLAASTLSRVRLIKSNLRANVATNTGGGIFAEYIKAMELEGIALIDNIAHVNGGAGFFDTSPVVARDVVCFGNVAHQNGGALALFSSRIELRGVAFVRNNAIEGSGGALYVGADSAVDITPVPECARVMLLLDWTQTSASCPPVLRGNGWITCDLLVNFCFTGRDTIANDVCDGCACHTFGSESENYFEIVANDVRYTGVPRAKAITEHEFCLTPNDNVSTYYLLAHDEVRQRGWFSGKLHLAVASEHGWSPAVEDFSFDGKVGRVEFKVFEVSATTTGFDHNVAGSGGGAVFHDTSFTDVQTVDNAVGNIAGYGNTVATPAVNLELQQRNETLATSSAIPFHVSAKLLDAKGQLVATDSHRIVDVHWSADVDSFEAIGTRNTTFNGFAEFDALTFMAPIGATCRMYLKSDALKSATINVSIVACPPGYEEELSNEITRCSPCRQNYYWREGQCRPCIDGMLCHDDGAVPLEHRTVGNLGALALKSGYHRQSVHSHRPVRCDGGKGNPACPGGIDSVGCNTKKFVLNKPRCQVGTSVSYSEILLTISTRILNAGLRDQVFPPALQVSELQPNQKYCVYHY